MKKTKSYYAERRAAGLCAHCGDKARKNRATCEECMIARRGYLRERYLARMREGACATCSNAAIPGMTRCAGCAERYRIKTFADKARKAAYMKEWQAKRRAANICPQCGGTSRTGLAVCMPCAKRNRVRTSARIRSYKIKAVDHLGGKCSDCGNTFHPAVFDFDHVGLKTKSVSHLTNSASWERIEEELKQCELVCSNCHRLRTWKRLHP